MKISACLITKNEAENIGRCLESLKDISNEIIVVDTGSTDNTVEIATSLHAKVYHYQWDNNFSNAKNYALDKTTGDWIIFLDADEYLESNTQKALVQVIKRVHNNKDFDAILLKMINTEGVNGRIISENPILRIFRGNCGIKYTGAIHEYPIKNGKPLKAASISDFSLIVYHTGYSSEILPAKTQRNLDILKEQMENNNIDDQTYYYMSSMNINLHNYEEAVKYALLALEEPAMKDTIAAYQPYVFLIKGMLRLENQYTVQDIEKYMSDAIASYPKHPEIWYVNALVKKAKKDYSAAIDSYHKAIECNKNFNLLLNNNFPVLLEEVYFDMATLCNLAGDSIHELEYYFEVLKINKRNFSALEGLYKIIKDQQPAEIIFFLNNVFNKEDKDDLKFLNFAMGKFNNKVLANYYYKLHEET